MNATKTGAQSTVVTVLLAAAALVVVLFLLTGTGALGNAQTAMGTGITISSVLLFLAKALVVVFLAGLVIGVGVEAWRLYEKQKQEKQEKQEQEPVGQAPATNLICLGCGRELAADWKLCPFCGAEKANDENKEGGAEHV